jgi:hypothetical protein
VGAVEVVRRRLDGFVERSRLTVHERVGEEVFGRVVAKPRLAENAGILGLGDAHAVGVQLNVVADAPAEGTRRVLDNRKVHVVPLSAAYRAVRTGRQGKRSAQLPAGTATADAPRHVAALRDLLPRRGIFRRTLADSFGSRGWRLFAGVCR